MNEREKNLHLDAMPILISFAKLMKTHIDYEVRDAATRALNNFDHARNNYGKE